MKYLVTICCIFTFTYFSYTQTTPSAEFTAKAITSTAANDTRDLRYVSKKNPVQAARFASAPVIDGILNDEVWKTAAVFGEFLQTHPGDNLPPTHPTEFLLGYDEKNLYVAFRVTQDKDKVRATVARRDQIFNDDYVLLYVDTFNDQRQAYVVAFNPLGIQADGTFTEGRGEDYSVDILMESKGVLTDDGFTVEAAIPFKSLRYEAGKNKRVRSRAGRSANDRFDGPLSAHERVSDSAKLREAPSRQARHGTTGV